MNDELMPEEIEIRPSRATTAFSAAEKIHVERASGAKIGDGNRQMEWYGHGR